MQNAIDFKELRRRERQKRRNNTKSTRRGDDDVVDRVGAEAEAGGRAKNNNDGGGGGTSIISHSSSSSSPTSRQKFPPNHDATRAATSNDDDNSHHPPPPPDPYENLLPQNKLSEDFHRISATRIDSVYYAREFLPAARTREVESWLRTVPEHHRSRQQQSASSSSSTAIRRTEREESLECNGKWTRLKHARRKVALFDGTIQDLPPVLRRLCDTLVAVRAFPDPARPPNHVLINEYRPGEGIMPHTDGPAYDSRTATVSLGGSDVIFKLWPIRIRSTTAANDDPAVVTNDRSGSSSVAKEDRPPLAAAVPSLELVLHGEGSLVVFADDAYSNHRHEIREGVLEETTGSDGVVCGNDPEGGTVVRRGRRVSLTFRRKKKD